MSEEINNKYQDMVMTIIANSGEAKSLAFDALRVARDQKDYKKAKELLKKADEFVNDAHKAQTQILVETAQGIEVPIDVLLIHSQDHLMTTMVAIELITEMVEMFK